MVIPAYNEAERLGESLRAIVGFLKTLPGEIELIVVDDGSTDQTAQVAESVGSALAGFRVMRLPSNRGKGAAVAAGVAAAEGDLIAFTDADNSIFIEELSHLMERLEESHGDIAVGARASQDTPNRLRSMAGRAYRSAARLLMGPGLHDPQCGMKLFRRQVAKQLFSRLQVERFSFDLELLVMARRLGCKVVETPVRWAPRPGSTVRPLHDAPRTMLDLLRIAFRAHLGHYEEHAENAGFWRWGMPLLLFFLALAVRLPDYRLIPYYHDEWGEVYLAYQIYHQHILPLHDAGKDIGALFNYVLAGLFYLFGPRLYLPRLMVTLFSAATVPLTYKLARQLAGNYVAVLAALGEATSVIAIINSHLAWSNELTPFFVVAAALATVNWLKHSSRWGLFGAGLLWGLALQTHSSVLALLPGLLLFLVWPRGQESLYRRAGFGLGFLGFAVGYANMIYYNLVSHFGSVRWIFARKGYALAAHHSPAAFVAHLGSMWIEFMRSLGSFVGPIGAHATVPQIIASSLLFVLLVLGATLLRGQARNLLLALAASDFTLIPLLNHSYYFPNDTRYILDLLPFGYVFAALVAGRLLELVARYRPRPLMIGSVGAVVLASLALLWPLPSLAGYYGQAWADGATNRPAIQLMQTIRRLSPARTVLLDSRAHGAQVIPAMIRVAGYHVGLMGDPWSNQGSGVFDLIEWEKALNHPGTILILAMKPTDLTALRKVVPLPKAVRVKTDGRTYYDVLRLGRFSQAQLTADQLLDQAPQ